MKFKNCLFSFYWIKLFVRIVLNSTLVLIKNWHWIKIHQKWRESNSQVDVICNEQIVIWLEVKKRSENMNTVTSSVGKSMRFVVTSWSSTLWKKIFWENTLKRNRISSGLINLRAWLQSTSGHRLRPVIYDLFASSFGALAPCFLNLTTGERYPCHKLKCIIVTAEHFKPIHSVVERRDRYRCWLFSGKNLL